MPEHNPEMSMQSDTVAALASALAKAQGDFPQIVKDKTAKVPMKSGGSYSYKYADFNTVRDALQPILTANGLSIVHGPWGDKLVTTLMHESGEWIKCQTPIFNGQSGGAQGYGSGMTYAKRYGMCAVLNVSADEDDDGRGASGPGSTSKAPPPETKPDPKKFADTLIATMDKADTPEALQKFWQKQDAALTKLKAMDEATHQSVQDAFTARLATLSEPQGEPPLVDDEISF